MSENTKPLLPPGFPKTGEYGTLGRRCLIGAVHWSANWVPHERKMRVLIFLMPFCKLHGKN